MLRDPEVLAQRRQLLETDPGVQPLSRWLADWHERNPGRRCPDFDPVSAGVEAEILVILQAPIAGESEEGGFVSVDNDDQTAANLWQALDEAGLDQRDVLLWNIVPWYREGGEAPTPADLGRGAGAVRELLRELYRRRVVVLAGAKAKQAWNKHVPSPDVQVIEVPLPAARVTNASPTWQKLITGLQRAATFRSTTAQRGL
jgi:hypothetical protein